MTEVRKTSWRHNAMLLGALAAGTFATRFVPAYQEHVGTVTYPSRAAASRSEATSETPRGYSQTEHGAPKLTVVGSSS